MPRGELGEKKSEFGFLLTRAFQRYMGVWGAPTTHFDPLGRQVGRIAPIMALLGPENGPKKGLFWVVFRGELFFYEELDSKNWCGGAPCG